MERPRQRKFDYTASLVNNFPKDTLLEPERLTDDNIKKLSSHAQKLYGKWLLSLKQGKTFFGLNWNWPDLFDSDPGGFYDTYVFSWHVESWPHNWLKEFCEQHPDSQVIVISEYSKPKRYYDLPNLKCLVYHSWGLILSKVLQYNQPNYVPMTKRKNFLSSLVNKPSYFKALTTAHLLMHHQNKKLIYSWNINKRREICPSLTFLELELAPNDQLKPLFEFYHSELKNKTYSLDDFNDTRFSNYFSDIPAYTDCLINVSNETYSQSYVTGVVLPGPFITDKTWKPLLAGCAMLTQGPRGIYTYLEQFGFRFDYPWDTKYDQTYGDIDRFLSFLKTLDHVLEMDIGQLAYNLETTTKHNYYHVRSQEFFSTIENINNSNLDKFIGNS